MHNIPQASAIDQTRLAAAASEDNIQGCENIILFDKVSKVSIYIDIYLIFLIYIDIYWYLLYFAIILDKYCEFCFNCCIFIHDMYVDPLCLVQHCNVINIWSEVAAYLEVLMSGKQITSVLPVLTHNLGYISYL